MTLKIEEGPTSLKATRMHHAHSYSIFVNCITLLQALNNKKSLILVIKKKFELKFHPIDIISRWKM